MQVSDDVSNCSTGAGDVVDALAIRCLAVAHATHLGDDPLHLVIGKDRRLAERQRLDIHARQSLDLDGQPQGGFERFAE
ncbi:hypothetical protein D9M69_710690 [compost metagenome]